MRGGELGVRGGHDTCWPSRARRGWGSWGREGRGGEEERRGEERGRGEKRGRRAVDEGEAVEKTCGRGRGGAISLWPEP